MPKDLVGNSVQNHNHSKLATMLTALAHMTATSSTGCQTATTIEGIAEPLPTFIDEFWTSKQRAAHSLHEISYRACFKPQLPHFFIEQLTEAGDIVYDPFMGRGTTLLEATLMQRTAYGCDINPLSQALIEPRLAPPTLDQVQERLAQIELDGNNDQDRASDLLVFYHPRTLAQLCNLRKYFLHKQQNNELDNLDKWIRMVALNRLTGHSKGFFSVYTMPPNQAVSIQSQIKINRRLNQQPDYRDVKALILKKSKSLLSSAAKTEPSVCASTNKPASPLLITSSCASTPQIPDDSVSLVVTSPPFLDIVQYQADNWLRCRFLGIDAKQIEITCESTLQGWKQHMTAAFGELYRVVKPKGVVAFEVGEVRKGRVSLEAHAATCGLAAGLHPVAILINEQIFTKTAQCWGVNNNRQGTNSNRIVLFEKS